MTTDESIRQTIQEESARNEKLIAWLRLALVLAVIPDFFRDALPPGCLWLDICCLAYLFIALAATYRWAHRQWFKYAITALDAAVTVYLTVTNLEGIDSITNFVSLALVACLLLAMASIRMSRAAVAYTTALVMLSFGIVLWQDPIPAAWSVGTIVFVLLLGCLSYFVMTRLHSLIVDVTRKGQLSRFLPPELVEHASRDPALLELGGRRQSVTVFIADIRRFSLMAEEHEPEEVIEFLNDYFRVITDVIFRYRGTLDKFMGDAVMALFGAPLAHPDDADRAVRAAVEVMNRLAEFNRERGDSDFCPVQIGVGLNTADVIAGNIGTDRRMEYTAVGDGVNLAARLEKLSKEYDTKIIISEATYDRLTDKLGAVALGQVTVAGRNKPVQVYGVPEQAVQAV